MFEEAQKLTVEDGILLAWFKAAMKEPSNKFIPSKDPSYIEQADYTRLFFSFAQGTNPSEGNFLWEQVNINPVNPDSPPISQNATLFEKFKDAVARNKFCAMNNMPDRIQSSLKIFGLTNTTPHEAFAAIRKEYVLALHPDKHPGKDAAALSEVEELSKCALTLLRLIKERNLKNND
ncbi:MAG: hypothetical protein LVR00_01485 [Rhabdochlamydiaceae bacterium]|jgi:hypothetical protein